MELLVGTYQHFAQFLKMDGWVMGGGDYNTSFVKPHQVTHSFNGLVQK